MRNPFRCCFSNPKSEPSTYDPRRHQAKPGGKSTYNALQPRPRTRNQEQGGLPPQQPHQIHQQDRYPAPNAHPYADTPPVWNPGPSVHESHARPAIPVRDQGWSQPRQHEPVNSIPPQPAPASLDPNQNKPWLISSKNKPLVPIQRGHSVPEGMPVANALTNGASQHSRTDRVSTTPFSRATDVVQPAAGFYDRGTSSANSTVGSDRGSSLPSQQPVARAYGVQVSRVNSSAPGGHERPSQSGIGKSGGTWDEQVRMAERAGNPSPVQPGSMNQNNMHPGYVYQAPVSQYKRDSPPSQEPPPPTLPTPTTIAENSYSQVHRQYSDNTPHPSQAAVIAVKQVSAAARASPSSNYTPDPRKEPISVPRPTNSPPFAAGAGSVIPQSTTEPRRTAPAHVYNEPEYDPPPLKTASSEPRKISSPVPGNPLFTGVPVRPKNSNLIGSVMNQHLSVTNALDHMTDAMGDNHSAGKQVKKIKLLGKGGFGTVYLATMDGGKAKVALKELSSPLEFRPYSQSPDDVVATLREAAIQALMVHTNIVRTYWADVSVVHPQTGRPLGLKFSRVMEGQGHIVEDCTSHSGELRTEPQAEWLSVEGLVSETKRLADEHALPQVVGLNVRIAMEYCELGSLIDYVAPRSKGAKVIPIHTAIGGGMEMTLCSALTALDIARGLKLLHKYNIVHGDLKPHNILIAANPLSKEQDSVQDPRGFVAKLSDFGLSKHMRRGQTEVNGITHGSVEYMPLEARQSRTVTKASDVYAFGIIMWELWHGDCWAPHFKQKQHKLKQQFAASGRGAASAGMMKMIVPQCWPTCPQEYAQIVSDCLDKDPSGRPTIATVAKRLELFIDKRLFPSEQTIPMDPSGYCGSSNRASNLPALDSEGLGLPHR